MSLIAIFKKLFRPIDVLNLHRLWAITIKETLLMARDYGTIGTLIFMPIFQFFIYGFAINKDPKHLDTIFVLQDNSRLARTAMTEIINTNYFKMHSVSYNYDHARELMKRGKVQFIITIPWNFSKELIRRSKPVITVEADASDPALGTNALGVISKIESSLLQKEKSGALNYISQENNLIRFKVLRHYNPESITQYNIAPGLIGIILTITLVMLTAVSLMRERETNTIEMLLSTPVRPFEVIIGKSFPYLIIGYLHVLIIYLISRAIFNVPMVGSIISLLIVSAPFILCNLSIGIFLSTIAKSQVQAIQFCGFFFLPSMMLGGFMFPTLAMPHWAQMLGKCFPLNNYLKAVRDIMLKGCTLEDIATEITYITLFLLFMWIFSAMNYRKLSIR